jgi:hypothetical protein
MFSAAHMARAFGQVGFRRRRGMQDHHRARRGGELLERAVGERNQVGQLRRRPIGALDKLAPKVVAGLEERRRHQQQESVAEFGRPRGEGFDRGGGFGAGVAGQDILWMQWRQAAAGQRLGPLAGGEKAAGRTNGADENRVFVLDAEGNELDTAVAQLDQQVRPVGLAGGQQLLGGGREQHRVGVVRPTVEHQPRVLRKPLAE